MLRKTVRLTCSTVVIFMFIAAALIASEAGAQQVYKIGAVLPFTGSASFFGKNTRQGTDMAVDEINAAGGINGVKLQVVYEDSKTEPKESVTAMNKLVSIDKVPAVMTILTGVSRAIIPIGEKNKVVVMTSAMLPGITEGYKYSMRNATSYDNHVPAMVDFITGDLKMKRLAILMAQSEWADRALSLYKSLFPKKGGEIVAVETFQEEAETDFRSQLTKVKAAKPEALFVEGFKAVPVIIKQAREMGIKAQILGSHTLESPDVLKIAKTAVEGAYYTKTAFDPNSPDKIMQEFQKKYKERYGETSEVYAATHYDQTKLIAQAIKNKGYSGDAIREYLLTVKDYPGISGVTTFLTNGDVNKMVDIWTIKDQKYSLHRLAK